MHAHYFQHVSFERLGFIETWLEEKGYSITGTKFYEFKEFPAIDEIDLLIVMGGPMSVNDEDKYPWLVEEKKFIKKFSESGKPILGICLGAQLIASAMGSRVFQNPLKEIGWLPVYAVESSQKITFSFPKVIDVFQWHGETFSLPAGAVRIAESVACKNQAFQLGNSVIGLQFHLEVTAKSIQLLIDNCRDELVEGPYIQTEKNILLAHKGQFDYINKLMADVMEYLHESYKR